MVPTEALPMLAELTSQIPIMRDERGVYDQWLWMIDQYSVTGVNSHDLRIVAAMARHRIRTLLTANSRDFTRYEEIDVMTPEGVLAAGQGT
jgi:hypothetical protein